LISNSVSSGNSGLDVDYSGGAIFNYMTAQKSLGGTNTTTFDNLFNQRFYNPQIYER